MKKLFFMLLFICIAGWPLFAVRAHGGEPHGEGQLWHAWNLSPILLLGLLSTAFLYLRGVKRLWARSGPGGGVARWQVISFFAGLLVICIALLSPVDALGEAALSWHMVQHLLLTVAAAPLIILGNPLILFLWAVPTVSLQKFGRVWNRQTHLKGPARFLFHPLAVWILAAAVLWTWHLPRFYQAALANDGTHHLQHFSFLFSSLLFWWIVIPKQGQNQPVRYGLSVFLLFTHALQGGVLGALLAFSSQVWYPIYQESPALFSASLLEDQMLAGLIMWIPPGLVYLGFSLGFMAKLLNRDEERWLVKGTGRAYSQGASGVRRK